MLLENKNAVIDGAGGAVFVASDLAIGMSGALVNLTGGKIVD